MQQEMFLPRDQISAVLFFLDSSGLKAVRATARPYRNLVRELPHFWHALALKSLGNLPHLAELDVHARDWEKQCCAWERSRFKWLRVPCGGKLRDHDINTFLQLVALSVGSTTRGNIASIMIISYDADCCALSAFYMQAEDRLHLLLVTCIVWKCAMMGAPGCLAAGESLDCRMISGNWTSTALVWSASTSVHLHLFTHDCLLLCISAA
jgi:hypothetical protein